MRKLVLAASLLAALPSPSTAAPCVPGTLAEYMGLLGAGCTVGSALFSDFTSGAAPGALPIDEADITVTPVDSPSMVGIAFGIDAVAGAGQVLGNTIGYRFGGPRIVGRGLIVTGTSVTPDGAFTAVQFAPDPLIAFDIGTDSELFAQEVLAVSGFFDVFTEITLDGGTEGDASLNGTVTGQFRVPEPVTLCLLGAGLGVVAWRRRVRRTRRAASTHI